MINNKNLLHNRLGVFLGTIFLVYFAYKIGGNVASQPEQTILLCTVAFLVFLGITDRAIAAAVILAIIFLDAIQLPINLAKLVGGSLIGYHLGAYIIKRRHIPLRNNPFLFCYFGVFLMSGAINGLGFINYPNKVLLFNIVTYLMVRYLLRDLEEVKKFLKLYCCLILTICIVVFILGHEGHRLLAEGKTMFRFGNSSNAFALLIVMTLPVCFYFSMYHGRLVQRRFFSLMTAFLILNLIWTASRSGMLGLLASILAMASFTKRPLRGRFIKLLIVAGLVSVVFIPSEVLEYSTARYLNRTPGTRASTQSRVALILGSLKAIPKNPILGVGSVGEGMRAYLFPYTGFYKPSHSMPLSLLLKTGLLGFTFFYLSLFYAFSQLKRAMRYFSGIGDEKNRWLTIAVTGALLSYFITTLFLHSQDFKALYVFLGIAQVINDNARQYFRSEKANDL